MQDKVVISFCDLTGHLVDPWVENGYHAILVDPQHPEGVTVDGRITKIGAIIDHTHTPTKSFVMLWREEPLPSVRAFLHAQT